MRAPYFLTSARLGFRHWTEDDLPLALALWTDPAVTALIGGPFSADAVQARLGTEITTMRDQRIQYWPVFLLDGDHHIGCAGLRPYRVAERIYEFGVHLGRPFWRQGFAEEAGRVVIDYAFGTLAAESLFAGHHPSNDASRRLLAKLGFVHTHEELYLPTGLMHPSYVLRRP